MLPEHDNPEVDPMINPNRSSATIAYVYKHTSVISGKSYIGQTIQSVDERWAQHKTAAFRQEHGCRVFENAINKYSPDGFTHEILIKTMENLVDFYEAYFINHYDTIAPKGYNLRAGGNGGCSDEMRAQMVIGNNKRVAKKSWGHDEHKKEKYIVWYHEINIHGTFLEGYRVSDHPNGRNRVFSNSSLHIDFNYDSAIAYKLFLDSYTGGYYDERDILPMRISRYKGTGFQVKYPGTKSKHINTGDVDADRAAAYAYLRSVCPEDQLVKVFKGMTIPEL